MSRKNHIHKKVSVHQNVTTTMTLQNHSEECPNNYDDHDYINLEKVSHIPKKLLVSMDGTGYNALSLLGWFCCKQVDPVTRKPIDDTVPTECAAKILGFISTSHHHDNMFQWEPLPDDVKYKIYQYLLDLYFLDHKKNTKSCLRMVVFTNPRRMEEIRGDVLLASSSGDHETLRSHLEFGYRPYMDPMFMDTMNA